MKLIILHPGTDVFARIKMGVGEKPEGWDLADHVLGRFSDEENKVMRDMLEKASAACKDYVTFGIKEAMNNHNN